MTGRLHEVSAIVVAPRVVQREAESMIDGAGRHFVVAHQAREDRQTCRVSRCPTPGTLLVVLQIPDCFRIRTEFSAATNGVVCLIHHAGVAIDYDDVLIAIARAI
jgi:hypothetical protein